MKTLMHFVVSQPWQVYSSAPNWSSDIDERMGIVWTTSFGLADGQQAVRVVRHRARRVGDCTQSHRDHGLLRRCRGFGGGRA
jgi:hypothetical protein